MPTLPAEELRRLDNLRKKFRIKFIGESQPEEWPECHRVLLRHLAELGNTKFRSYATDETIIDDSPWKLDAKKHARDLVTRASRNKARNENTWRHTCEPYVLARLSGEVVCRTCRKRLWRSELEACNVIDSQSGLALHDRQKARERCRCHRIARSQDHMEASGLNAIFGERYDDAVKHDPFTQEKVDRLQRPDAVLGLRQTRNLENLLLDTRKHQGEQEDSQVLYDELLPSPLHDRRGEELLYPFLVLEAKAGKGGYDWHDVNVQTAFPIRTFLETQSRLFTALESHQSRPAPLVWYFANKGEDWRVSVAFMAEDVKRPHKYGCKDYVVVDAWQGSICTLDGALQLLLIVDYVFDWARDVYREEVIRSLRTLASGDNDAASTLYADKSMIRSLQHIDQLELHSSAEEGEDYQAYISAQSLFVARDTAKLIVRHAAFIESKYCCLLATRDNVRTMLLSTRVTYTQRICSLILNRMSKAMLLNQSMIEAMEERWTGTVRVSPTGLSAQAQFYTAVSCTNYLSDAWHQIRELYIIAIADDAWDIIVEYSKLKPNRGHTVRPKLSDVADQDALLAAIDRFQAGTAEDTILACITRKAVELRCNPDITTPDTLNSTKKMSVGTVMEDSVSPIITSVHEVPSDGIVRDIVHHIYTYLKKGSLEPQDSFLRTSTRFQQQHQSLLEDQPLHPGDTRCEKLKPSKDGCVLIKTESLSSETILCLYIVNGNPILPTEQEVAELVICSFETRDVYHTTRYNGTANPASIKLRSPRTPWNLQQTYGISGETHSIMNRLGQQSRKLQRQGSPRVADGIESGGYLWERTMIPWSDPRLDRFSSSLHHTTNLATDMFHSYKLLSQEIRYWKEVSVTRNSKGIWACMWCAATESQANGNSDICLDCCEASKLSRASENVGSHRPRWFHNHLNGDSPFTINGEREPKESDQPSERAFVDGQPTDLHWENALGMYPAIDYPFDDLEQLLEQRRDFRIWHKDLMEKMNRKHRQFYKRQRV